MRCTRRFRSSEVSGRTYPVQVVYEPLGTAPALMRHVPGFETGAMPGEESYAELSAAPSDGGRDRGSSREPDMDMPTAVARACAELIIHSSHERGARDILVFASGERDIHEFENALRRHYGPRADDMRHPDAIEIMPLFARLSSKEQHRVFEPHTHQRIVIATNVAETSLTVPGHPLRGRPGHGPHQPVFKDRQGAAAAHRADQPGERRPAVRPVRPYRGRHRHPPVFA